jgi:hypothetical protein
MNAQRPRLAVRFLPSMTDFVVLAAILFLFGLLSGAPMLLGDGDTGWHIRTGEWILANGRVPDTDLFSFTRPGEPWFAWEWLWDVVFAWLHQHWGLAAVVLGNVLIICLTAAVLFRLILRKCANVFVAALVSVLALAATALHWLARPHLVTPLFVVVFVSILERVCDGRTRLLFVLPFLTILWTNLHGGFGAGLVVIAAYAAGEALAALVEPEAAERRAALLRGRSFLYALAGCLLATLVNPYGYRLHAHIWSFLRNRAFTGSIEEYASLSFQHPGAIFFEILLLAGAVAAFRSLLRKQFVYVLLFAGWCHLALQSTRHIPIFAAVTAPIAAQALAELLEALKTAPVSEWIRRAATAFEDEAADFGETDRIGRFHLTSALALLVVAALLFAPSPPKKFRSEFDPRKFPAGAIDVLRNAGSSARVFSLDSWGGYLIYRLYPSMRVFIDGRTDFYGPAFCESYLDLVGVKHDWQQELDRYRIDTVLLPVREPLAAVMKASPGWRVVHDDGVAIVFRRTTPIDWKV